MSTATAIRDTASPPVPRMIARADLAIVLAITALGALLRLTTLGSDSYWLDEAVTLEAAANRGFGAVFVYTSWNDTHPALYHLILHAWLAFGKEEFATRALSAFAGIISIPLVYRLGRMLAGSRAGSFAALLLALSPFHVAYSQELRMYSLVTLLTLLMVIFYWRWLRAGRSRDWLGFVAFGVLAAYADQSAALALVALAGHYVLTRRAHHRSLRHWLSSQAAIVLLSAPPAVVFIRQMAVHGGMLWVPHVSPLALLATLQDFSVGYTMPDFLLPVAFVLFSVALVLAWTQARALPSELALLTLWALLPMALLFALSIAFFPVYVERALLLSLPAYLMLIAIGVARVRRPVAALLFVGILSMLMGGSLSQYYKQESSTKPDARPAASYVAAVATPRDLVLHPSPALYEPFQVYHRLLGTFAAPEYRLLDGRYWEFWHEVTARWQAEESSGISGTKAPAVNGTPYGDWRRSAWEYDFETLKAGAVDAEALAAVLPTTDRVLVVLLTDEGEEMIGRQLYSTRNVWHHPMEVEFVADKVLPGYELTDARHFEGIEVRTYARR